MSHLDDRAKQNTTFARRRKADVVNGSEWGEPLRRIAQSIFEKAFPPFGLADGQVFAEFDLIYSRGDMLFWAQGTSMDRGFDKEENRPTNLKIPLVRKGS